MKTNNPQHAETSPAPSFTIAVCTHNRDSILRETLDSFFNLYPTLPAEWEFLVVDNASTDQTPAVCREFPAIVYRRENTLGLSHARNLAVCESRGDWVVFVDDDVFFVAGWLEAYTEAIHTSPPQVAFLGGPVQPHFGGTVEPWMAAHMKLLQPVFGLTAETVTETSITDPNGALPVGANLAFRKAALPRQPFSVKLGRRGHHLLSMEETEIMKYLLNGSASGSWVLSATLRHRVPRKRMTPAYVRRFYRGVGSSLNAIRPKRYRQLISKYAINRLRILLHHLTIRDPFALQVRTWMIEGRIQALRQEGRK